MHQLAHILFSRSVLLVYVFIGYLSIIQHEIPHLDRTIPSFSNNDRVYPSAKSYPVALTEHSRSDRFVVASDDFEPSLEMDWSRKSGRLDIETDDIVLTRCRPLIYRPSRAPPVMIVQSCENLLARNNQTGDSYGFFRF